MTAAIVLDTGRRETLPSGINRPIQVAVCGEHQWKGPERTFSLFSWRAQDDADQHNDEFHAE